MTSELNLKTDRHFFKQEKIDRAQTTTTLHRSCLHSTTVDKASRPLALACSHAPNVSETNRSPRLDQIKAALVSKGQIPTRDNPERIRPFIHRRRS